MILGRTRVSTALAAGAGVRARLAELGAFAALGVCAGGIRVLTLPHSYWESDELLFGAGVRAFEPALHHPHPPGFPLFIGLGKLMNLLFDNPFAALLALAVLASALGAPALAAALRRACAPLGETAAWRLAAGGTLLFHLSAGMLVQGSLPMSDGPTLLFLCLSLLAGGLLLERPTTARAIALALAAAAAVGCRPQLAPTVVPLLAAFWLAARRPKIALASAATFAAACFAWLLPLVWRLGGLSAWWSWETAHAAAIEGSHLSTWRAGWTPVMLIARFTGHPWGPSAVSLPILALAVLGAVVCWRRRLLAMLPWAVLAVVHTAFCLLFLEPADGVRYALPATLAVAAFVAIGAETVAARLRVAAAAPVLLAVLALGGAIYAWPVLAQRLDSPSPPAQAAAWGRANLPRRTLLAVDDELLPHAAILLPDLERHRLTDSLDRAADHPGQPLFLLSAGESRWPGAQTFRWDDSPAYRRLTRNHYRVVSLSPVPAEKRYRVVSGVYPYEPTPALADWRWLAPDARLRVFPFGATEIHLAFALPATAPWPSNRVGVRIGDGPAASVDVLRGQRRELALAIPSSGAVDVTFASALSFVPSADGAGADHRRLGVQLVDLALGDAPVARELSERAVSPPPR